MVGKTSKYPALRLVSLLLTIQAGLLVVVALLAPIGVFALGSLPMEMKIGAAVGAFFGALILAVYTKAAAELAIVFVDIESAVRGTELLLQRRAGAEAPLPAPVQVTPSAPPEPGGFAPPES